MDLDILVALANAAVRVARVAVGADEWRVATGGAEAWIGAGSDALAGCAGAAVVRLAGDEGLFAVGGGGDDWGVLAVI